MKVSRDQVRANRRRILDTAAALFRERGFEGIGVADLMKASGLTHGGFYRHFPSKEGLAAEATRAAYEELERESEGRTVDELLASYLSPSHRDDLAHGCPTAALGVDAMRQAEPVKAVFAEGVARWLETIGAAIEAKDGVAPNEEERRRRAIELATRAVGAIVLARTATANAELSDEILEVALATSEGAEPRRG